MNIRHKTHVKWTALLLCILALTLFLAACSPGGQTTVVPTPTPAVTAYTGDGYTLSYPQGWKVNTQGPLVVFTSNSDPGITFSVSVVPTLLPGVTVDDQLKAALQLFAQNYQQDNAVASTETVGGETWQQRGATTDRTGQKVKGVVLGNQHSGKIFVITMVAKADNYDQAYNTSFKPILDSFKFT